MSNSIWKTPDQKPDVFKPHTIMVIYEAHNEAELMLSTQYEAYTADRYTNRWCYLDELFAQANKAERLEKENEAMREEFEVWHGNHKCVLEDNERLQKALDLAVGALKKINETYEEEYYKGDDEHDSCDWLNCADDMDDLATDTIDEIKQLIKGE